MDPLSPFEITRTTYNLITESPDASLVVASLCVSEAEQRTDLSLRSLFQPLVVEKAIIAFAKFNKAKELYDMAIQNSLDLAEKVRTTDLPIESDADERVAQYTTILNQLTIVSKLDDFEDEAQGTINKILLTVGYYFLLIGKQAEDREISREHLEYLRQPLEDHLSSLSNMRQKIIQHFTPYVER